MNTRIFETIISAYFPFLIHLTFLLIDHPNNILGNKNAASHRDRTSSPCVKETKFYTHTNQYKSCLATRLQEDIFLSPLARNMNPPTYNIWCKFSYPYNIIVSCTLVTREEDSAFTRSMILSYNALKECVPFTASISRIVDLKEVQLTDVCNPLFTATKPQKLTVEGFSTIDSMKNRTCREYRR